MSTFNAFIHSLTEYLKLPLNLPLYITLPLFGLYYFIINWCKVPEYSHAIFWVLFSLYVASFIVVAMLSR